MKFSKYHGTGNDFIIIHPQENEFDYQKLAREICDRHMGVGADGLMYYSNSKIADIKMHYINRDGSIAKMCGNGIRCLAKFLYDEDVVKKKNFIIETLDGLKEINISKDNNIRVNMGKFESKNTVPVTKQGINDMDYIVNLGEKSINAYSLQFGVPHTVILEKENFGNDIEFWGPKIENKNIYNDGTNVNFVKVINEFKIEIKTWERGAGHTLSCGTGCCATAIVLNKLDLINNKVEIIVEGGILKIIISDDIILIGPAIKICKGEYFE